MDAFDLDLARHVIEEVLEEIGHEVDIDLLVIHLLEKGCDHIVAYFEEFDELFSFSQETFYVLAYFDKAFSLRNDPNRIRNLLMFVDIQRDIFRLL